MAAHTESLQVNSVGSKRIAWVIGGHRDHPAIRWRFGAYARLRGFQPVEADIRREYDLIWLSQIADYTQWAEYPKGGARVIVDLCDDYLSEPPFTPKDVARELGKYVFGQHAKLRFSFREVLEEMCRRADAVIVGSETQMEHVRPLCPTVVQILDIHTDSLGYRKTNYRAGDTFHIGWEGFPALEGLASIMPVLRRLAKKRKLALHCVTNPKRYRLRNHFPKDVRGLLTKLCHGVPFYLYDWNAVMTPRILTACDLAIIPLDMHDKFSAGKPANKLVFLWQLGIPVVASAIRSYVSEMEECGTLAHCCDEAQWYDLLEYYMCCEDARRNSAAAAIKHVDWKYSESRIAGQWDNLVNRLLGEGIQDNVLRRYDG